MIKKSSTAIKNKTSVKVIAKPKAPSLFWVFVTPMLFFLLAVSLAVLASLLMHIDHLGTKAEQYYPSLTSIFRVFYEIRTVPAPLLFMFSLVSLICAILSFSIAKDKRKQKIKASISGSRQVKLI